MKRTLKTEELLRRVLKRSAENTIKVKAYSKKRTDIYLTIDGRKVAAVKPYTDILIRRSKQYAKLIRLNDRSFYKTLSGKFKDGRSI